jgi:hypothetical protein
MAKIKAKQLADVEHRTTARLSFPGDDGERQTDDFVIIYRGMSPKMARELNESLTPKGERIEIAKYLAAAVKGMPEVVGEDDQPVACTFEFFDAMEPANLAAIFTAVQEGYSPNDSAPEASLTT